MTIAYRRRKKQQRLENDTPEVRAIRNKIRRGVKGYLAFVFARDKGDAALERFFTHGWRIPGKRGAGSWRPRLSWRMVGFIDSIKKQEAALSE